MAIKSKFVNPVAAAVGVAFVSSLAASTTAVADDNPFSTADLDTGYQLAGEKGKEGACGEKGKEGSCGEKGKEGSCGEKGKEGSCGDHKEKGAEASCGADKEKGKESACGGNV